MALTLAFGPQGRAHGAALVADAADGVDVASEGMALAATAVVNLTYGAGWNMVSLPVAPTDPTFDTLFPDAISAFQFAGSYQQVQQLDTCTGYWLNLGTGGTYTLDGTAANQCVESLPVNWSMVGTPFSGIAASAIVQNPTSNIISIFGFAGAYQQVNLSTGSLTQGEGYWFNLGQAGQVTMDATTPAAKRLASTLPTERDVAASKLVVSSAGAQQTVYLGVALDQVVELPPTPPAGVLDVRAQVGNVQSDRIPFASEQADYRVRMQGSDLQLRWDVSPAEASQWQLLIDGQPHSLTGSGTLSLNQAPRDVVLRYSPAPTQFGLKGNYPNPFNPTTTIAYEVGNASPVSLVVYDVIGQKVRTLVNEMQAPGAYSAVWNGRNEIGQQVANGLYFYELQAGDFRSMRKMMLTK